MCIRRERESERGLSNCKYHCEVKQPNAQKTSHSRAFGLERPDHRVLKSEDLMLDEIWMLRVRRPVIGART